MIAPTPPREVLCACPPLSPFLRSRPFFLYAPVPIPLPHLDSLPFHDLVIWTDCSVPVPFGIGSSYLSKAYFVTTLSFSAGLVCSSFSAEACAILQAICWSRQHKQVSHFSSRPLLSLSFYLNLSGRSVFSLLLNYQTAMGSRTLVSPVKRRGLISWPDGERYSPVPV